MTITTARGASCRVVSYGAEDASPVVFLHGAPGLLDDDRFFVALAARGFRVVAPELPGYGTSTGEELLEDMLDFTLHGWDAVDALGVERPVLIGHSMGGMIAAEMAAVCPTRVSTLVLIAPNGLWDDGNPIPDLFTMLPYQFPRVMFRDKDAGAALLTGGNDFSNMDALTEFFVGNARRLGTAGKILFPIPNRRLSKRLYRVTPPTLLVWGADDAYIVPTYAARWEGLMPNATISMIDESGHMVPYEAPDRLAAVVGEWLARAPGLS